MMFFFKKNIFLPKFPTFAYKETFISLLLMGIIGVFFDVDYWFYIVCTILILSVSIGFFIKHRTTQIKAHSYLKAIGLQEVWNNFSSFSTLEKPANPSDFIKQYELTLLNSKWRHDVHNIICNAEWTGVVDLFLKPHEFRWELNSKLPTNWNEWELLSFYITMMSVIPHNQKYLLSLDSSKVNIKGDVYFTDRMPREYIEAPLESIKFWLIIQKNLDRLLDLKFIYNKPTFKNGLASDVVLGYPTLFTLSNGLELLVNKNENNDGVTAQTVNNGVYGSLQEYDSANSFWWVWRNAIERRSDISPL